MITADWIDYWADSYRLKADDEVALLERVSAADMR